MITIMILIKKRPDLTMDQFVRYYEDNHSVMANRLFPMYHSYKRFYVEDDEWRGVKPDYSVITEIVFKSSKDYEDFCEIAARPEVQAEIKEDEAKFMIPEDVRMFRVSERT